MIAYEGEASIKGPHQTVVIPLVMRALAAVHESFPQNSINLARPIQPGTVGASPLPNLELIKPEHPTPSRVAVRLRNKRTQPSLPGWEWGLPPLPLTPANAKARTAQDPVN